MQFWRNCVKIGTVYELIKEFRKVRDELITAVNKFPQSKREEPLFEGWSLKDVIAHFAGWDLYFTQCVQHLVLGEKISFFGATNSFNKETVAARKNLPFGPVHKEFVNGGETFIREFEKLDRNLWRKKFWPKKTYTPLAVLKINIDHYKKAQLKDIQKLNSSFAKKL